MFKNLKFASIGLEVSGIHKQLVSFSTYLSVQIRIVLLLFRLHILPIGLVEGDNPFGRFRRFKEGFHLNWYMYLVLVRKGYSITVVCTVFIQYLFVYCSVRGHKFQY